MEKVDLKGIERKAYTSYHQDGLIDIIVGFSTLGIGVWLVLEVWLASNMTWMVLILVAIVGPSAYAAGKRAYTVPRIGFVKFPQKRVLLAQAAVLGLFSLSAVLGVLAFIQFEAGGTPGWLLFVIENSMLVIGVSVAALFGLMGYTFRISRMYAYALVTLPIFAIGHFLDYPLSYFVIPLGALILLVGSTMLIRFVRKYPLPAAG
ncbi:MAG: hypothetical protein ACE5JQ_15930 [Candidatus Methylomirabilales bacterium]